MRRLPTDEEVAKLANPPWATANDACGQVLHVPSMGIERECAYGKHIGPHYYDHGGTVDYGVGDGQHLY
jgi:hypothetical protein